MKKLISIVIPVYNEEESIPKLIKSLQKEFDNSSHFLFEVVLVENGSSDNSLNILRLLRKKDKRMKILQLAKNFGCDGGIIAGLTYAKGDAAIVMMADLQEEPVLIKQFIQKWEEGYDVVYGIVKDRTGTKFTRRVGTFLFYKLINIITNGFLPENVSDFRLLDKKVYSVVVSMPEHNKFFRGLVSWAGFRQIGIPFNRNKRVAGHSKANLKTVFYVAANGIFSFSDLPLKIPLFLGILFFVLSIILFIQKSDSALLVFLFACVMVVFYIQNEYFKRVIEEVRNRPNFIVKNEYGL